VNRSPSPGTIIRNSTIRSRSTTSIPARRAASRRRIKSTVELYREPDDGVATLRRGIVLGVTVTER
jgi:hypothetical protein